MNGLQVIVGGQYGSEGKGAIAAYLSKERESLAAVRVAGPNAGHTVKDRHGTAWPLRQIPVAAVANMRAQLFLAAGSEIDEQVLADEIRMLDEAGYKVTGRLHVDGTATMITDSDKKREAAISTGSTAKGIGGARAARVMREAPLYRHGADESELPKPVDTSRLLRDWLAEGGEVLIEGTQGYGLGTHAGYYPFCTSSDCRAIDFLAMAGLSPWAVDRLEVWMVLRTYPIRIAGDSGPMLHELSWDELARSSRGYIKPEYTTVTQKQRRIGLWDPTLARNAVEANGGGHHVWTALTFFDYWYPELAGVQEAEAVTEPMQEVIRGVERATGGPVHLLGTGPDTVIDLRGAGRSGTHRHHQ